MRSTSSGSGPFYGMVAVLILTLLALLGLETKLFLRLLSSEQSSSRRRETEWATERERLLNRAMTKDWQSYAQLQSSMVVTGSPSEEYVSMSDEAEAARAGFTGFGEEVYVELDTGTELSEIGFGG